MPSNIEENWIKLIDSIKDAAHRLNLDLTEAEMPDYMNWPVARNLHVKLWAQVFAKDNNK